MWLKCVNFFMKPFYYQCCIADMAELSGPNIDVRRCRRSEYHYGSSVPAPLIAPTLAACRFAANPKAHPDGRVERECGRFDRIHTRKG